jgi:predicted phosphohydrolase
MKPDATENLLEEDHRSIDDFVAQLCAALEAHDAEQSFALLDLVWARLAVHIRAEHLCLFPALLDAARQPSTSAEDVAYFDEAQSVINLLRLDHDFFMVELARAVNTMREIDAQDSDAAKERLRAVRQTISAVKARLAEHNKLEEEQVYRWPASRLDSSQQAQLAECVRRQIENMPPRFA